MDLLVAEIFEITPVLIETILLLTSSFTIGLGDSCDASWQKKAMMIFFGITLLLGARIPRRGNL